MRTARASAALICGLALMLAAATSFCAEPAPRSAERVAIDVPKPPTPVRAGGALHLLYELRIANHRDTDLELNALSILGDERPLATFTDHTLAQLMTDAARVVRPGAHAVVFLDLALGDTRAPGTLSHVLPFAVSRDDPRPTGNLAVQVEVAPAARPLAGPPLAGGDWVAVNGLSNPVHRRALLTVDGRQTIAQRFAIDWIRLAPDGRYAHGPADVNANWVGYGADVLAVGDARVVETGDRIPENVAGSAERAVPITLETALGNHVVLDLGDGRFASYAHLQPGSLTVNDGDRVKAGQVIGKLGNSGNSDAPHLHFQLTDGPSPLGSEGIPYTLGRFEQRGVASLDESREVWQPGPGSVPRTIEDEFPVDGAVIRFR